MRPKIYKTSSIEVSRICHVLWNAGKKLKQCKTSHKIRTAALTSHENKKILGSWLWKSSWRGGNGTGMGDGGESNSLCRGTAKPRHSDLTRTTLNFWIKNPHPRSLKFACTAVFKYAVTVIKQIKAGWITGTVKPRKMPMELGWEFQREP